MLLTMEFLSSSEAIKWCGCFCVFALVFLCFCGGVFFGQGSTFVALPRSYAKSVDNTGVKRCLV